MIFNMMGKYKLNIIVTKVLVYVGILVSRYLGGFTDTEPWLQYKNGISLINLFSEKINN